MCVDVPVEEEMVSHNVIIFSQVYQMKRHDVEKNLVFCGFLVISCPLKQDSKKNVQCLLDSSHYVS